MSTMITKRKSFLAGMKDGIPIALGYFAVSFSLGIAARSCGLNEAEGFLMSLLNNASAGEYAGLQVISENASYLMMALMTLVANGRYLLMSFALSQRISPGTPFHHRLLLGFDITDEIFGITVARSGCFSPYYTYGAMAVSVPCWASGTALGVFAGNILPAQLEEALRFALFGMFIAVFVPPARKSRVVFLAVAASFLLSSICAVHPYISRLGEGTRTILLTIIISAVMALFFPVKTEHSTPEDKEAGGSDV